MQNDNHNRRSFLKKAGLLAGSAAVVHMPASATNWVSGSDVLKIALIGCGGRGTGAADQVLNTKENIRLVAMAEPFENRLEQSYNNLLQRHGKEKVIVPPEHRFTELDGYKKAIALADVVLMASPPGFRPLHFEEAVAQGKHCFLEKPVATDVPGVHKVIELSKLADEKGLKVLVGHHLRFQPSCIQLVEQIHQGSIGEALSMSSYFNSQGVWVRHRQPEMTEMEYQLWNWYYFNWLSGDHIVEQHVHNLDFINWVKGTHPVKAQGMGGREVRNGKEYGDIFDHHYVEFEYPDGSILNSQSRHIKGCWNNWTDVVHGTNGKMISDPGRQIATILDPDA
jgi:myo-inositol 2-dehydrogenase / D-chiro-inositol 1-dehydrogenase